MMMNRRAFSTALLAGAAASLITTRGMAANATPPKARNVVLVHGLFADGSCWSEVIARLQAVGLNATSVQNPLTTLPEAVASAERVLARQDGPTVLVGHSFSGMIVTDAGVHPNDAGRRRRGRIGLGERSVILAGIGRARRHIDERRDVRMHAGLCDDHSGKGMADQNRRAVLPRQHALG